MIIRCIAVDDEPFALGIITDYCSKISFLKLVKTFNSGIEAIDFLKHNQIDLIFLDVEMRDISGMQLLDILKPSSKIILTTAFDKYAIQGYEYNVTDYLLKPFTFERFLTAVTKCIESNMENKIIANSGSGDSNDHFFLKSGYSIVRVNFNDIFYIEGQKDYLMVRTEKEKILTLNSFKQFKEILPSNDFIRVHRSYIVSLKKIGKIEHGRIKILDALIPVGDSYKVLFMKALENRMME